MTQSFAASLEAAGQLIEDEIEAVFLGAVQDTSELITRRQASVKDTGGTFEIGFVPVDEGELINSSVLRSDGADIASGANGAPPDFAAAIGSMTIDTVAEVAFTAEHARPMEYGFRVGDDDTDDGTGDVDVPGRFYVRTGVQEWETVVLENARYIRE